MNESKACRRCGITRPIYEFYEHPMMADGHLNICGQCVRADNNRRREERMRDPKERERERDRLAAWRAANPERTKAARARAYAKYYGTDKELARSKRRCRRTHTPAGTVVSLVRVLRAHGRHCHICDRAIAEGEAVHYDHVIPLARGGPHTEENLRPAHRSCNAWKHDRLMSELVGVTPPPASEVDAYVRELRRQRRSEQTRARMAAMTPEERAERGRKISAAKKGVPHIAAGRPREPRKTPPSSEEISRRADAVKAAWQNKTPEEREAWRARCRAIKAGSPGNLANLAKGWAAHDKAISASAEARRGKAMSEEQKQKIAAGLKAAYAEGRRTR